MTRDIPMRHDLETSVWQQTKKSGQGSPAPSVTNRGTGAIPPSQDSLTGIPMVEGSFSESPNSSILDVKKP